MAFPIERMMALESSANPPRVSATTGMKSTLQSGRLSGGMPACAGPRLAGHGQGWKQPCARSAAGEAKLSAHQVLQGDHGSRWGGVCLPALSGSRGPH